MTGSESYPGIMIVTSAMRTGSTWLVSMLRGIAQTTDTYANSVDEAISIMAKEHVPGIIKAHGIIDRDWNRVPLDVPIVRLTRNFKDSLISRALYVKNIRAAEGESIGESEITELLAELGDASDQEYVATFVDRCSWTEKWLAEIAVMERGDHGRCHTLRYELLMHNPYDVMLELTDCLWPGWTEALERVEPVVKESLRRGIKQRASYLRNQAVGVGGWEAWLSIEQSERLDGLYQKLRLLAHQNPTCRWPEVLSKSN
jgi:hypothetical protein